MFSTENQWIIHKDIRIHRMGWPQWVLGLGLGIVAGGVGYLIHALTPAGALAAVVVGTLTMGGGGIAPAVLLLLFFFSSSVLSRASNKTKRRAQAHFSKNDRRDPGQVLANGALAAVLAVLYGLRGEEIWFVGLAGALAAVTADTWATELGVLASGRPRLITTGESVEAGTSGGITLTGTVAAAAGASLIALAGSSLGGQRLAISAAIGGLGGALFDSVLGATIQAIYHCPACDRQTERHPLHSCGTETVLVRGWPWLENDAVNFFASVAGALIAIGMWGLLG
jgi:uncharacterized protein (TIGR00297 family)